MIRFSNENNCAKLILNTAHHGWVQKKIFHSRLSKTAFNRIFSPFYRTEKLQICILYQTTFIRKDCFKYCKKSLKIFSIKLCGILHMRRKLSLLRQKIYKSSLSNFYFCHQQSSSLFEKHLAYSTFRKRSFHSQNVP